jgi:hypothetical protein
LSSEKVNFFNFLASAVTDVSMVTMEHIFFSNGIIKAVFSTLVAFEFYSMPFA